MAYYHDLITEKSWRILQELKRQYQFILIGGWAVYLHASALKSKDIDIIPRVPEVVRVFVPDVEYLSESHRHFWER